MKLLVLASLMIAAHTSFAETAKVPKYACSVACSNGRNQPLLNHPDTGTGLTREEALNAAKENLQANVKCTYDIVEMGCEYIKSQTATYSCSASCIETDGSKDLRSLTTMKARTAVEAKVIALKTLVKKFACNYTQNVTCK